MQTGAKNTVILDYIRLNRELIIVFVLYTISFGLLIFNNGVFWDDWIIYNQRGKDIIEISSQTGIRPGYLHLLLSKIPGVLIYRIGVFILYFLNSVFIYWCLKSIRILNKSTVFLITLLFTLLPLNSARIAIINFPYAMHLSLFYLGLYLIVLNHSNKSVILRTLSLLSFLISFFTKSFILYYGIAVLLIIYLNTEHRVSIRSLLKILISNIDYILLPFLFLILEVLFFHSRDIYSEYNSFTFLDFQLALFDVYTTVNETIIQMAHMAVGVLQQLLFFIIVLSFCLYTIFLRYDLIHESRHNLKLLLLGIVLFAMGVIPYLAVGKKPEFIDWNNRHQLLLNLGLAIILYSLVQKFTMIVRMSMQGRAIIYSLIMAVLVAINYKTFLDFQKDWFKQKSLMSHFRVDKRMTGYSSFLFKDQSREYSANLRTFRHYEYSGMMKTVFGDDSRFGEEEIFYSGIENYKPYIKYPAYNSSSFKLLEPQVLIEILPDTTNLSNSNVLQLMYLRLVKPDIYEKRISGILKLKFTDLRYGTPIMKVINPTSYLHDPRDSMNYKTVRIGNHWWMAENLNYGTFIVSNMPQSDNEIYEKYCNNDDSIIAVDYGGYYQWDEAMKYNYKINQGICPEGWHIPTVEEWTMLIDKIEQDRSVMSLKEDESFGFELSPAGYFDARSKRFIATGQTAYLWTSTKHGEKPVNVFYNPASKIFIIDDNNPDMAFSIRCIKNE